MVEKIPFKDRGIEYVKTRVDLVGNELLGLFHKAGNLSSGLFEDNHPILARFLHLGHNYGAFPAMVLVEGNHVPKWEITDDITVENKEGGIILPQNVPCQGQGSSCA